ncbi:MAG: undecaprenyldiphospho-muramoylpentapeptide beta-N-acetylglucosaminyltransferase [Anaerolineae bacterium]|nr:undecaprenyldiphospho-muramoylpentapeptide beta-N-acetylglucosaminyltransferase [Phycisphaerae bacterium]
MSENPATILLAGGGTGGHLYPGIAVAEALRARARHITPVFLCTQRAIDTTILSPTGFEFIAQPIVPPALSVGGLLRFFKSWRETKEVVRNVIRERKPAAVLGLGGYAAGVAVKTAALKNIPAALLNPDVIPGKANQYLMRYATHVCCGFEQTREHVSPNHASKLVVTGCPIRSSILALPPREQAASRLGLDARLNTLMITGASQGAVSVNEAVLATVGSLKLQGWQILHLSGKDHSEKVRQGYREQSVPAVVVDFTPAMSDVWAVTDLAIARSGASTIAELTACGVPSILMPYPFHKDMHQRANARVLSDAGAAVLVDDAKDAKLNAAKLKLALETLLHDSTRRKSMSEAAKALGRADAADAVAQVIARMLQG